MLECCDTTALNHLDVAFTFVFGILQNNVFLRVEKGKGKLGKQTIFYGGRRKKRAF